MLANIFTLLTLILSHECHSDGTSKKDKPNVKLSMVNSYNNLLALKVKALCMEVTNIQLRKTNFISNGDFHQANIEIEGLEGKR